MDVNRMLENKFSQLLGKRRIKISTISKATGISRTTLTGLCYGRTTSIEFATLERLCEYLNCTIGDIFEFKKEDEDERTDQN
jgi:putative transcriptional regulator